MARKSRPKHLAGAVQLIDEALYLIRHLPISAFMVYYLGAVPFVFALLFFVNEMLSSAFAWRYCATASLAVAAAFVWMKAWQSRYCAMVWGEITGREPGPVRFRDFLRLTRRQLLCQPLGLLLLPWGASFVGLAALVSVYPLAALGTVLLFPLIPLTSGFCQGLGVYCGFPDLSMTDVFRRAGRQASSWYLQHLTVCILLGIGTTVALLGTFNLMALGPMLLKTLLGIETTMSRGSQYAMLNTGVISFAFGLGYLIVDPVIKAIYVLRCFYVESRKTGADLRADLKAIRLSAKALPLFAVIGLIGFGTIASAQETENSVAPDELKQVIRETVERREFTWRMPRGDVKRGKDAIDKAELSWIDRILDSIGESAMDFGRWCLRQVEGIGDWIGDILEWLIPKRKPRTTGGSSPGWITGLGAAASYLGQVLKYVAILAVMVGIGFLIVKLYRLRQKKKATILTEAEPALPAGEPDLESEEISADVLPEDGWLRLAREQVDQGNLRLALRALYLGSLAHLGDEHLIMIARFKSNRDYMQELQRRAHALPGIVDAFRDNTRTYESAWYGMHNVTDDMLAAFRTNAERIRVEAQST